MGGGLCDINFGMGDLVGGTIGRSRGGGRLGHGGLFCFFLMSLLFLGARNLGRREKIRSDLKKYNASWSLCRPWVSDR